MAENSGEILSPDKALREIKLESYFNLLNEFVKYRRLVVYRRVKYPKINWINSLITFYDAMFSETNDEKFKENFGEVFKSIKLLDYSYDITYRELINLTRSMMSFAYETGITKLKKHTEGGSPPGGADYYG